MFPMIKIAQTVLIVCVLKKMLDPFGVPRVLSNKLSSVKQVFLVRKTPWDKLINLKQPTQG